MADITRFRQVVLLGTECSPKHLNLSNLRNRTKNMIKVVLHDSVGTGCQAQVHLEKRGSGAVRLRQADAG